MSFGHPASSPSADELQALAAKYRTLARWRREKLRGEAPPERSAFRGLAHRFPGALRELETLPLDALDARASALEACVEHARPLEPWMRWVHGYHRWMRAALWIKPRVARNRGAVGAFDVIAREASVSLGVHVDAAFACACSTPADGRLRPIVLERVASELGDDARTIHAELFPSVRRPG